MKLVLGVVTNKSNNLRKTIWLSDYSKQDKQKIIDFYKQSSKYDIKVSILH